MSSTSMSPMSMSRISERRASAYSALFSAEDFLEVRYELGGFGDLRFQLVAFQARQLGQAHVQDFLRLDGRQVEAFHQAGLGRFGILRRCLLYTSPSPRDG